MSLFMINKPYGFLSQFKLEGKHKHRLLGELYDFPEGTMAIGRLDKDSEGLLLLTTDGKESERIRASSVEKEYIAQLDGIITEEAMRQLQEGVEIGFEGRKYVTKPCISKRIDTPNVPPRVKKIRDDRHGPTCWISIILSEGKFRQIRKMTAAVGFPTLRLIRIRIGHLELGDLAPGEVIPLQSF
jgi:23S rRNA pseudouridine2457 synthase